MKKLYPMVPRRSFAVILCTVLYGLVSSVPTQAKPEYSIHTLRAILSNKDGRITGGDFVELIRDLGGTYQINTYYEVMDYSVPNFEYLQQPPFKGSIKYPGNGSYFEPIALSEISLRFKEQGVTQNTLSQIAEQKNFERRKKLRRFRKQFKKDRASTDRDTIDTWRNRIASYIELIEDSPDQESLNFLTDILLDDFRRVKKPMFNNKTFVEPSFSADRKAFYSLFHHLVNKNDPVVNDKLFLAVNADQITDRLAIEQIALTMSSVGSELKYPLHLLLEKAKLAESSECRTYLTAAFNAAFHSKFGKEPGFKEYFSSLLDRVSEGMQKRYPSRSFGMRSPIQFTSDEITYWKKLHAGMNSERERKEVFKVAPPSKIPGGFIAFRHYLTALTAYHSFLDKEPELTASLTERIIDAAKEAGPYLLGYQTELLYSLHEIPTSIVPLSKIENEKNLNLTEEQKAGLNAYFSILRNYYLWCSQSEETRFTAKAFGFLFKALADLAHLDSKLKSDLIDFSKSTESSDCELRDQISLGFAQHPK